MGSECNIVWSKHVTDLSLVIESRDGVDPVTALDRAIYELSNKVFERRPTDEMALIGKRHLVALRGWEKRRRNKVA